jgi:hypothetical protein
VLTYALILGLGLYLGLSVVNQLALILGNTDGPHSWQRQLVQFRVHCRCLYLPMWTFFSWVPEANVTLLIRDRLVDGQLTPWRAVNYIYSPWARFLWNPDRRREKAVLQLSVYLVSILGRQTDPQAGHIFSLPSYCTLLHYCVGISPSALSVSRQFVIVKRYFANKLWSSEICFISPHVPLARQSSCG